MNLIHKSIKYASREKFFIPFEGRVKTCLKEGDFFEKGKVLFEVERRKRLGSYYLPENLGVKARNSLEFVNRIEGEYVSKNDIVAEKLASGGLLVKRVLTNHDGIVSLKNINLGYIDIFSELGVEAQIATFDGSVEEIDFGKGIFVQTDVCEVPFFYSKIVSEEKSVFGTLEILTDTASLPSFRKMPKAFEDKVVFAGRFLYPELANELFKRGCKFILVGSMNYDDLKNLDVPVGILTGFGNIFFDSIILDFLKQLNGRNISVSLSKGVLQFPVGLNDKISQLFEQNYYAHSIQKDDIVRSVDLESFGLIAQVKDLDGSFANLVTQEGSSFTVEINNLEVYNEEFSLMRTRVF